jgi:hypothetical protein
MVARSIPSDVAKVVSTDAPGLIDAYNRLRHSVREVSADLRLNPGEFDLELPSLQSFEGDHMLGPERMMAMTARAKAAAISLRSLAGHVEGLIEAVVLDEQITMEQVQAAREAARQPTGFQ